jgi:hypothetical protein
MDGSVISKEALLKSRLLEFYSNKKNVEIFLNIILQKTKISLRLLDWFVTNYCKKNNTSFMLHNEVYYPFKVYKLQLKAYSKKYCDPFCRRERVIFDYKNNEILNTDTSIDHHEYIITTIGQMNFFKFVINDNIINYINTNINLIEDDMNSTLKNRESEKSFLKIESIKRKELSKSANRSVNISIINAVIKFV